MTNWNLQEAKELIRARYSAEQYELARQSLGSTVDRLEYARFHYREAKALLDTQVSGLHKSKRLPELMWGFTQGAEQDEFQQCLTKIAAHVTACVQNLHSLADIFAHAIYYSLGYNLLPGALEESRVDIGSVRRKLALCPEHAAMADALNELASHNDFLYLKGLVNHSKHRSLIRPTLWMDMTGQNPDPYALRFQKFSYKKGENYPQREIRPYLESEFDRLSLLVIETGIALNVALAKPP